MRQLVNEERIRCPRIHFSQSKSWENGHPHTFSTTVPSVWNCLEPDLQSAASLASFKFCLNTTCSLPPIVHSTAHCQAVPPTCMRPWRYINLYCIILLNLCLVEAQRCLIYSVLKSGLSVVEYLPLCRRVTG